MVAILFFILVLALLFLLILPSMILSILSRLLSIFGLGRKKNFYEQGTERPGRAADEEKPRKEKNGKKKIFSKDEGEYVDFEEIK